MVGKAVLRAFLLLGNSMNDAPRAPGDEDRTMVSTPANILVWPLVTVLAGVVLW